MIERLLNEGSDIRLRDSVLLKRVSGVDWVEGRKGRGQRRNEKRREVEGLSLTAHDSRHVEVLRPVEVFHES